ncbi:MAG: RNase adapter RapZ [Clostridia bacterium]|nr:RNase adapter RapZ [Clostridia bacterium]
MTFVIVSGLSGAGKSQAMHALEDIGFYCVDNMPPKLLPKFGELCLQSNENLTRVSMVVDVRGGDQFRELFANLDGIRAQGGDYKILFLECDDAVLARRYKETRRQHPLAYKTDGSVRGAIALERDMLDEVRSRTDYLIDTTHLSTSHLKKRVEDLFLEDAADGMLVECMSFGFKYGYPAEADLVFDVRCFPNPFYIPELKTQTGMDAPVREFVLAHEETQGFLTRLYDLIDYLVPLYRGEGKSQLVIAIGCTGGKHRSVTIAQTLAQHLEDAGDRVRVNHRDIQKH